jgi:F-type H+-transporting ATPase subunit b
MELVTPGFGLIFWQLLIFLLVLFLLSKFAWKPIMSALREREAGIEEALREADRARLEMQKLQGQNEALLQEARVERDRVLRDAQAMGNQLIETAKQRATEEGARQLAAARQEIDTQKRAALAEMRNLAGTLSLEIAEKILRHELKDAASQKSLVAEYLKDVKLN